MTDIPIVRRPVTIQIEGDSVPIDIRIVSRMEFGGKQSVVVYEAPGSNSGTVITTGRVNREVTLTGRILLPYKTDADRKFPNRAFPDPLGVLDKIKGKLEEARDLGKPVVLRAPVTNNSAEKYIIEDLRISLEPGQASALPFTMTLQEFRQANIRRSKISLVHFAPAAEFVEVLVDRALLIKEPGEDEPGLFARFFNKIFN